MRVCERERESVCVRVCHKVMYKSRTSLGSCTGIEAAISQTQVTFVAVAHKLHSNRSKGCTIKFFVEKSTYTAVFIHDFTVFQTTGKNPTNQQEKQAHTLL